MQRGDVGATGFVLVEKSEAKPGQGNPMNEMMSALQAVGSALGATRKEGAMPCSTCKVAS